MKGRVQLDYRLTRGSGSKFNPIEPRSRNTRVGCRKEFRSLGMKQDVQVRAVNVIWSNVGGGRTATLAVGNGALYPPNPNLFPEMKPDLQRVQTMGP